MKWLGVFFFVVFSTGSSLAQPKDSSDWLFVYYLPYDNDLSGHAQAVIRQLQSAQKYDRVNVAIQMDLADSSGMQRISIVDNTVKIDTIAREKMASKKELKRFLKWTTQSFQFNHSALFFLDHGGRQDEIGQDLYPDSTFLKTKDMHSAIAYFNKRNGRQTELIYLQVCNKASLETLYEFHDLSGYTLASQLLLGAPNYYYEGVFQEIQNFPEIDGGALARHIIYAEDTSMYESLTCVKNAAFPAVREAFVEYVDAINQRPDFGFKKVPKTITYGPDRYWDFKSFLQEINSTDSLELEKRKKIVDVMGSELITFVRFSPGANTTFSGMSIAALSKQRIQDFHHMKFYRDFRIADLPLN